ncbi:PD-(D/E)XK motif protein [Actinomadura violacea]|uniref:PD-(D/E)XK motif protein n=1 Tax=Actinomadura violacea TaxID=2819934 RepID=A0ABS3RXG3_9ACTN|nr:PD-(D/E)XK motif protein [Actinomadura violacea]MBO2461449.1 PD-(D/E)XK motif protein [Actinomadura violacea]
MNDSLRKLVERHWVELEAEPVSGERKLRVANLPGGTRLAVAVDHEGHRHILVPVGSHQKVRRGLDGPVLLLRKRPLEDSESYQPYADLACLRPDLNDLFSALCADVLETTESFASTSIKALYRVLDRWKALFSASGAPLGHEQLAGLFAELKVLEKLLQIDPSAHRLWRGPSGHRHDFTSLTLAVEVKASLAGGVRRARIHGLDQMDPPPNGALYLAWYRLSQDSTQSERFLGLVDRILRLCDDESAVLTLLAEAGYRIGDADHYHEVQFVISEERWYIADSAFPALRENDLVTTGIPINVTDVTYTIDLSTEPPHPQDSTHVNEHLNAMIQESP